MPLVKKKSIKYISQGYLKLVKGPEEFVNSTFKNARDLFIKKNLFYTLSFKL